MEMLVRVLAVLVRGKTGMGMAVEPALVFRRAIQLDRHLPDRAVMVVVIVMGGCHRLLMHVQAHAQARIEFRMVGKFQEPDLCRLLANQLLSFHEGLVRQPVDLVENNDVGILQLLVEDRIQRTNMLGQLRFAPRRELVCRFRDFRRGVAECPRP